MSKASPSAIYSLASLVVTPREVEDFEKAEENGDWSAWDRLETATGERLKNLHLTLRVSQKKRSLNTDQQGLWDTLRREDPILSSSFPLDLG
jgi:hypothetical protein